MANCCFSMFRGVWSFLIGSLRMILFFMCLLYVLIQALCLMSVFWADSAVSRIHLPTISVSFTDYLHAICLLILGLLGAYGAFYRHHPSIRAFSLLSALNTLLLTLLLLYTMGPDDMRNQNEKIFHQLEDYMPDYKWDSMAYDHMSNKAAEATRTWNGLQTLACCGIKGPDDWEKYLPKGYSSDSYPSSCCAHSYYQPQTDICTNKDTLFKTGCSQRVAQLQAFTFMTYCVFIMYQLALSVIAYMVGNCTLESRQSHAEMGMAGRPHSQNIYVDNHYQQQPPVNREFPDALPQNKYSLPPMYPNLHGSSNVNYSAPPPSYGT